MVIALHTTSHMLIAISNDGPAKSVFKAGVLGYILGRQTRVILACDRVQNT